MRLHQNVVAHELAPTRAWAVVRQNEADVADKPPGIM